MSDSLKNKIAYITEKLTHEEDRVKIQFFCVYLIFIVVSGVMTIINVFQPQFKLLMLSTLIFTVLNILNAILSLLKGKFEISARVLFSVEIILLFTFFILIGQPEGFSAIWCSILPLSGLVLYRRKIGSILAFIQFLIVIFFFWLPVGKDILSSCQPDGIVYTSSFMLRFPVFYLACFGVGFFFETVRAKIQVELTSSRNKFENMSYYDVLTGLGNHNTYYKKQTDLEKIIAESPNEINFAVILLDLNSLKTTNDNFGHHFGDLLIQEAGNILKNHFKYSLICHIGGDEFVVFAQGNDYDNFLKLYSSLEKEISYKTVNKEGHDLVLSVASGYAIYKNGCPLKDLILEADKNMYENKKMLKTQHNLPER